MTTPLHAQHPRPLMARPDWQDLNGAWAFANDPDDIGLREGWPSRQEPFEQAIRVPYPPESRASGVNTPGPFRIVWYQRTWHRAPRPGRRVILHFGAVDYAADVWVNGRHVVHHEGGHTPFHADVTPALDSQGRNSIVVRAHDEPSDLEQPRGKQDWQERPHAIWYERTTGIWQSVWAEEVPAVHIGSLRWTPVDDRSVELEVRFSTPPREPVRVGVRIFLGETVLVDDAYRVDTPTLTRRVTLFDDTMEAGSWRWTPERPTLCDAIVTVHSGTEADSVHSYVGLRTVGTDSSAFLLNRGPYYPRLVMYQGYWPQSHLAAPDTEALRRDVELIRSLGFNGVRVHQKVEDPRFLYWCDRLGLLVFADAPASYRFSPRSLERTAREWMEIVERDASNPCVAAWVAFNESWGVGDIATSPREADAVRGVYHLIRACDPTRPVIGNDGWEYVCGEMLGIHDYNQDPAVVGRRYADPDTVRAAVAGTGLGQRRISLVDPPNVPVLLTEFGGVTLSAGTGGTWSGYGGVDNVDDLLKWLAALFAAVGSAGGLAGFCYTQFADTAQERNGLVREDRAPKADPATIARLVRGE
jgi:beta-galactosidase/beta-glucuronidase